MLVNSVKDMTKFGKRYGNLQRMQIIYRSLWNTHCRA